MIFFLKISLLVSLTLTSALSMQLWAHRKVLLSRMLLINMILYSLWALWVMLTLLSPDFETKIIFTKIRQVTNPFIVPVWIVIACIIFYRDFWDRYRKWISLVFVFPLIASLVSVLSLLNVKSLDFLLNYDFQLLPEGDGLLTYQIGPLLKNNFLYGTVLLLTLYAIYIHNLFSSKKRLRQYAILFFISGIIPSLIEIIFRHIVSDKLLIQYGASTSWVLTLATYYGVTRLEFLNIKSYARERTLELLPNPVLTITPRMELWDTNFAARELFDIREEELGKDIQSIPKFGFMFSQEKQIEIQGTIFQIFKHEIETHNLKEKSFLFVLNDVTKISELNQDLEESNSNLKELNEKIIEMTNFNKKINTVLSHDMTGVLGIIHGLSHTDKESNVMNLIHKASASSLELLRNILSWSQEDKTIETVDIFDCLDRVISQLTPQLTEKEIQVELPTKRNPFLVQSSSHMMEAIYRNVITNAIKYGPQKSSLKIEAFQTNHFIEIHISDSGRGLDQEDIENILNHRPTKSHSEKGYGIGLRFTMEFVQHLNGNLNITSVLGNGTTVKLRFPKYV